MPEVYTFTEIKGYVPAVDPRRLQASSVIAGRNYLPTLDGLRASFHSYQYTLDKLYDHSAQIFSLDNSQEIVIATNSGFLRWDGRYVPEYPVEDLGYDSPWTFARLNNRFYFCKRGQGLIEYDRLTGIWQTIIVPDMPFPQFCCAANGRLIVVDDFLIAYSAQDNGRNFTPSLETGAGFQALSLVGGTPLGLLPTAAGFVAYTTLGVLSAEYSSVSTGTFRFQPISKDYTPINPWCCIQIDGGTHLILDKRGFFQCDGRRFTPWQEEFTEGLTKVDGTIRTGALDRTSFKLFYSGSNKLLFVSYTTTDIFRRSFVHYFPRQEWGSFDKPHTTIAELTFDLTKPEDEYGLGYLQDGYWFKFGGYPDVTTTRMEPTFAVVEPRSAGDIFRSAASGDTDGERAELVLYGTDISPSDHVATAAQRTTAGSTSYVQLGLVRGQGNQLGVITVTEMLVSGGYQKLANQDTVLDIGAVTLPLDLQPPLWPTTQYAAACSGTIDGRLRTEQFYGQNLWYPVLDGFYFAGASTKWVGMTTGVWVFAEFSGDFNVSSLDIVFHKGGIL